MLWEKFAERHGRRLVDDEADVAIVADRSGDEDARAVEAIVQVALGDEEHRLHGVGRPRERRSEHKGEGGEHKAQSHDAISGHGSAIMPRRALRPGGPPLVRLAPPASLEALE